MRPCCLFYDRLLGSSRFIRNHASCLLLLSLLTSRKASLTLPRSPRNGGLTAQIKDGATNTPFRNQLHHHKKPLIHRFLLLVFTYKKNTQLGATHNFLTIHNLGHYSDFAIESDEMGSKKCVKTNNWVGCLIKLSHAQSF